MSVFIVFGEARQNLQLQKEFQCPGSPPSPAPHCHQVPVEKFPRCWTQDFLKRLTFNFTSRTRVFEHLVANLQPPLFPT